MDRANHIRQLSAEVVFQEIASLACSQLAMVDSNAGIQGVERAGNCRDPLGKFAVGVAGDHSLQEISGEGYQIGYTDLRRPERVLKISENISHHWVGWIYQGRIGSVGFE